MRSTSTLPSKGEMEPLKLSEIIKSAEIQIMMDNFYKLSKIPMAIIDLEGNKLVGVGWQDICTKFHRVNPISCRICIERYNIALVCSLTDQNILK